MIKLDDFQLSGYVRINQGENRDIEFDVLPSKFVLESFKTKFFDFLVKSFNGDIQNTGFKFKLLDDNGNVIIETNKAKLDLYETEDSYIAEVNVSYQDSSQPTDDRYVYKVEIDYVVQETSTDENGNTTTNDVDKILIVSDAPQKSIFAEPITGGKKAIIIHKDDGKAEVLAQFRIIILK